MEWLPKTLQSGLPSVCSQLLSHLLLEFYELLTTKISLYIHRKIHTHKNPFNPLSLSLLIHTHRHRLRHTHTHTRCWQER